MFTTATACGICLCVLFPPRIEPGAPKRALNWSTASYVVQNEIAQKMKDLLSQRGVAAHTLSVFPDDTDKTRSKLVVETATANQRAIADFIQFLNDQTIERAKPVWTREAREFEKRSAGISDN